MYVKKFLDKYLGTVLSDVLFNISICKCSKNMTCRSVYSELYITFIKDKV